MQMLEINYEVRNACNFVFGSENQGWASSGISFERNYLDDITANTEPNTLAVGAATAYINWVRNLNGPSEAEYGGTVSVIQSSQIGTVATAVDALATNLIANMELIRGDLVMARTDSQKFARTDATWTMNVSNLFLDLRDLCTEIWDHVTIQAVRNAATNVLTAMGNSGGNLILFEDHQNGTNGGTNSPPVIFNFDAGTYGLSIYFPQTSNSAGYSDYNSSNFSFCSNTHWDEFLNAFLTPTPALFISPTTLTFNCQQGGSPGAQNVTISNSGSGTLSWSSIISYVSGSGWLSINPTSQPGGNSTSAQVSVSSAALVQGTYHAHITITGGSGTQNSPQIIEVTLTVSTTPTPALFISPTTLTFNCQQGGSPGAQNVTISNSGSGTLSWSSIISYVSGSGWLSINPTSQPGGNSTSAQVSVSSAALVQGTYHAHITITGGSGTQNSPQIIEVTLTVSTTPTPALFISPTTLTFNCQQGGSPGAQNVTISNSGSGTLSWSSIISYANSSGWLSINPSSNTSNNTVAPVSVSSASLGQGTYHAHITITGGSGTQNSPQIIEVTLTVSTTPTPALFISPTTLTFGCQQGASPAAQNVTISNSGSGTLSWSSLISYANSSGWLNINPASQPGNNNTAALVSVSSASLVQGTYHAHIVITGASGTQNSPQTIEVTLTVNQPSPSLLISPLSLNFSCQQGQSPASQNITISNSGVGTLSWSSSISYANVSGWLSINPASQTSNNSTAMVSVSSAGLSPSTYHAHITVAGASGTQNSPQIIEIDLAVFPPSPALLVSPLSLSFNCQQGGSPAAQIVTISNNGSGNLSWNSSISYVTGSGGWMSINPTSQVGNNTPAQVSVSSAGLVQGTYHAHIVITGASGTQNSPQTIEVTLTVNTVPAPALSVSPLALNFGCQQGGSPGAQNVTISNSGSGTLSWSSIISYVSGSGWLSINPSSNTSNNTVAQVSVSSASLGQGTCHAHIVITGASGTQNSPQIIEVTLTVNPPSPSLTVSSPNGWESWIVGSSHTITWISSNLTGNLAITLSRNGGSSYNEAIVASVPVSAGSYNWTVTGPTSTTCRVKATSLSNPSVFDASNSNFTISGVSPDAILYYQLSAGWNMIAVPLTLNNPSPEAVFPSGWPLFRWDALQGRYAGRSEITLALGVGYWLDAPFAQTLTISGQVNGQAQTEIPLSPGSNLIGTPYHQPVPWALVSVSKGTESISLEAAMASGWIKGPFYSWTGATYQIVTTGGSFQPTSGYWIKDILNGCSLVFGKPF